MALTATYTASLRTLSYTATGTVDNSRAQQEYYVKNANRVGLLYFPAMDFSNKKITGIKITVTAAYEGYGTGREKTAYLRKSNYQTTSVDGAKGSAFVGDLLGTFRGEFYGNTTSYTLSGSLFENLCNYLMAGNNTLVLYNPTPEATSLSYSTNYFLWTAVSMEVTYQETTSQPTLDSSDVILGTPVTITTNRQSTEATHTLRYSFGSMSGTIAENVGDNTTWTPPISLATEIPSAISGLCIIYCDTYIGGAIAGTAQILLTLNIPANILPSISNIAIAEATKNIAAKFGAYIRTHSTLSIKVGASGVYGSTITSYRTTLNGIEYTGANFTTSVLNTAGENQITVTVTDSRGRSITATRTVTVLDYAQPRLMAFAAERCSADGSTAQADGERVRIAVVATASSCGGKNTMSGAVYYRARGETNWRSTKTLTATAYAITESNLLLSQSFDPLSSYELKVSVADYFTTVEQTISISTKQVLIDFYRGGTGIAFGKAAEKSNTAEFGWPIALAQPLEIASGGTGATTKEESCANIGAVSKTGDTMTGTLKLPSLCLIPSGTNAKQEAWARVLTDGTIKIATQEDSTGDNTNALVIAPANTSADNALSIQQTKSGSTTTHKIYHDGMTTAIPISKGGTGATTGEEARKNLGIGNASELNSGTVPMARLPYKMACGTISASGSDVAIDYSAAGFTKVPCVTVTYATTDANWNGSGGTLKVHSKTLTGAKITVGGYDGTRTADWIAMGV